MNRVQTIENYHAHPNVQVLIIGGGVNGIATFRDLALQGIDVLLVERGDFCSGTSAASSHMLHGGIRYLENGEFRLVREALQERNRLLRNAPHLAKPLPTTIPIFSWFSGLLNAPLKFLGLLDRPSERGAIVIKLGLMLYDWFVRGDSPMPNHKFRFAGDTQLHYPDLNQDALASATYYDAYMPNPERLCLEMLLDAEAVNDQAVALNYVSAVDSDGVAVYLRDETTGEVFAVQPEIVVNAAGPWIDFVNRALGQEKQFIRGTKGAHIVLEHPELLEATNGNEIFFENNDGRIVLIFPWMGRVMIGTTDIYVENPNDARCTPEEIDYILGLVSKVFPTISVDQSHIVYQFSGVRPLPYTDAKTTGQISRDHKIQTIPASSKLSFPIYSLVGGKWTTHRAFGEHATDVVLEKLKTNRSVDTRDLAIGGGKDYPADIESWLFDLQNQTELSLERLQVLFDRYGTCAKEVAQYIYAGADQPLANAPSFSTREIEYIVTHEKVQHLGDVVFRRTLLAMRGELSEQLLVEIAEIIGDSLSWDAARRTQEIVMVVERLQEHHGVDL